MQWDYSDGGEESERESDKPNDEEGQRGVEEGEREANNRREEPKYEEEDWDREAWRRMVGERIEWEDEMAREADLEWAMVLREAARVAERERMAREAAEAARERAAREMGERVARDMTAWLRNVDEAASARMNRKEGLEREWMGRDDKDVA